MTYTRWHTHAIESRPHTECTYTLAAPEAYRIMDALKRAREPTVLTRLLAEAFAADTVSRMP